MKDLQWREEMKRRKGANSWKFYKKSKWRTIEIEICM